ncbi:MAG: FkbM family methyltransferase [Anaerolineaceae bacterium]|nr:FkbM family methyltransferase [Anaerolineaceae bacterium]
MKQSAVVLLDHLGTRLKNLAYILSNPSYTMVRHGKGCAEIYQLLNKPWFPKNQIDLVIDIGANEGQFIHTALALVPNAPIIAFEPNPELAKKLKTTFEEYGTISIFSTALGSQPGVLPLNVSKFAPASSFLQPTVECLSEFPGTDVIRTIDVEINRLDDFVRQPDLGFAPHNNYLLKIDVQGYEMEVVKGAVGIYDRISTIVCELNIAHIYENQRPFEELFTFLREFNFHLVDIGSPIRSRSTNQVLYVDIAFKKLAKV